ncbi:MAG: hypothetical protein ACO3CQ_00215 [Candidatus Nanopelagicaceae bacterium]
MEDDFYASIKLISGEEIFARVVPCEEENKINLLVTNPITITEVKSRNGLNGYKIEPWIKTTKEDMFILSMENVITISETEDIEMIKMHQSFVRKFNNIKSKTSNVTKEMGYIGNINDAKILLEKIFNIS